MATPTYEQGAGSHREQGQDTGQAIESLKQELSRVSGQVQNYLKENARQMGDKVQEQTSQATEAVHERIRANPLAAVGIATGVGLAVGLLVLGSRHSGRNRDWRERFANGDFGNWRPRDATRELRKLRAAIEDGFEHARARSGDPALLDRFTHALSNLLNSSTASSMASAGTRAAKQFVDRFSGSR